MSNFVSELARKGWCSITSRVRKRSVYARLITVKPEKLHVCKSDDGVISFHVQRGLLLLCLGFMGFLRPQQ